MARFTKFLAAGAVVVALGVAGCSSSSSDKASSDTGSSSKKSTTTAAASSDSAVSTDSGVSSDTGVSSDSAVSTDDTGASSTPSYVDGKNITDAHAWAQDLLKVGGEVTKSDLSDPDAYAKVFQKAFPTVLTDSQLVGYGVEAPTNGLSGAEAITPKQPPALYSALGFAVKDSKGDCAGGIITISEDGTEVAKTVALPSGAKCTGQAVYDAEKIV